MEIWKYPLELTVEQTKEIPRNSELLCVQLQGNSITVWMKVDPAELKIPRRFWIVGTGHPIPEQAKDALFCGTVQMDPFVWHVFMEGEL